MNASSHFRNVFARKMGKVGAEKGVKGRAMPAEGGCAVERVGKEEVLVVWCGAIRSSRRAVPAEIGPSTSNYTQTPFTMITRMYVQLDMHTSSNGAEYALAPRTLTPKESFSSPSSSSPSSPSSYTITQRDWGERARRSFCGGLRFAPFTFSFDNQATPRINLPPVMLAT